MTIIFGIFLILNGLVHLLYAGQSWRLFELRPGLLWPDGSWIFSKLLGDGATRIFAGISLAIAGLAFVGGGFGLILRYHWWRPLTIGAAAFSALLYILLWNGSLKALDDQGGIGVLISLAILVIVLIIKWPS
jgi:hypothetical protein